MHPDLNQVGPCWANNAKYIHVHIHTVEFLYSASFCIQCNINSIIRFVYHSDLTKSNFINTGDTDTADEYTCSVTLHIN